MPDDWPHRGKKSPSSTRGKLRVAKLNVDENPQTAGTYDVMSIPTLIVYKGGQAKKRIVGARPKHAMLAELAEFICIRHQASGIRHQPERETEDSRQVLMRARLQFFQTRSGPQPRPPPEHRGPCPMPASR